MGKVFLFVFLFLKTVCCNSDDYITVSKNNVTHKFVHFDEPTDGFVKLVFPTWENETFAIFESVKDPQAIAIDIGAWIGTTSIWLSKNFSHVLAIEADRVSLNCLKQNLQASGCFNVSICEKPVAATSQNVIFGGCVEKFV
jgi:tRNA/tmRNA/rRNA uracil-C5-methylase (TrmA/RlmC/RlmD family)